MFASIENELKLDNVFNVYSQAFVLMASSLLSELETWVVKKLLSKSTAVFVMLEGIRVLLYVNL